MRKSILKLAKKNQVQRFLGGCSTRGINVRKHLDKRKNVNCNVCRRPMDVKVHEHQPYYCYRCNEEAEVQQR